METTSGKKGKGNKGAKGKASTGDSSASSRPHLARPPSPAPLNNSDTREQISQLAMMASITGQAFEDVKFYAYSRRNLQGIVDTPLPLFGNSALIRKASPHFNYVLARGFRESLSTDMDAPYPSAWSTYTEDYDYGSDSDLEDEPEEWTLPTSESFDSSSDSFVRPASEVHKKDSDAEQEEEESGEKKKTSGKLPDEGTTEHTSQRFGTTVGRVGRIVPIDDIAYRTWHAFVFYAYFDKVTFAPLKSQGLAEPKSEDPHGPPACSPKSMYRLAEKYGIDALKKLAADSIKAKLTTHNVLTELFSSFTLLYEEIQDMQVEFLHTHLKDATLKDQLPKWLQKLEKGELPPGAADVFAKLMMKSLTGGSSSKCPSGCNSTTTCNRCGYAATFRCSSCGTNIN